MKQHLSKSLFSVWLLALFVTYQASISMFTHVHYINGVMLTHSHPFQGKHSHSSQSILVIDRLSSYHLLVANPVCCPAPERVVLCTLGEPSWVVSLTARHHEVMSLRAPPVLFFS